jgi:DNA repair exonuclease SbcCD nuclease subunit
MSGSPDSLSEQMGKYDYVALGGQPAYLDLSCAGYRAAFSGSPEPLNFEESNAGNLAVIQIDEPKKATINKVPFGHFSWKRIEFQAKEIANNDDLLRKIQEYAGPNMLLRVKLSGLALFEAGLDPQYVYKQLQEGFAYLDIIDEMIVFPENVADVKASEKTILGQYLRLIVEKMQSANENQKEHLENSIKIGYSLLSGRELW